MLLQAYAGHMSVTGEEGRPSIRNGPAPIDVLSGTNAALGIMMALYVRKTTGRGQYVETSLYRVGHRDHEPLHRRLHGERRADREERFAFRRSRRPTACSRPATASSTWAFPATAKFLALCKAIGREELVDDPRFSSNAQRIVNRSALHEQLFPVFGSRPAAHWVETCIGANIPVSLVETVPEVVQQDQLKARNMLLLERDRRRVLRRPADPAVGDPPGRSAASPRPGPGQRGHIEARRRAVAAHARNASKP